MTLINDEVQPEIQVDVQVEVPLIQSIKETIQPASQEVQQESNQDSPVHSVDPVDQVDSVDTVDPVEQVDQVGSLENIDDITEKRQLINGLLNKNTGKEGEEFYLISSEYFSKFHNLPVDNLSQLKEILGPINCTSIVDPSGNLYPENNEPLPTYNISKEIFNHLSEWMGIIGTPVTRFLVINPQTGAKEVERFPPRFVIHQLGQPRRQQHITAHFRNRQPPPVSQITPPSISLSRTKTFYDLFEMIRTNILNIPPRKRFLYDFRIWFVDVESLPFHIPISAFVFEIGNKTLVNHSIFGKAIKSQGINQGSYNIVIEVKEKNHYPVDQFVISHINNIVTTSVTGGGHLGLSNLGNTCYMNSALQCLLHVPEINYYFYYNIYKQELNMTNPLGYHGNVANSFGSLLKQAFDKKGATGGSISPRDFKSTIGKYSSMFSGYLQQDSQEFLSWLLDALHEDLNRIHQKPYCEKPELNDDQINDSQAIIDLSKTCWNQHLARNDSVITDLFTGLYQSTLVCPDCSKTSITFDPFNDLTLPLPISKKWYHTFTIVDLGKPRIMNLEVELKKTSNFDDLLNYLSKFLNTTRDDLFIYEIFHNSFYSDFQKDYIKNRFHPIGDIIRDNDEIIVYIIPHEPGDIIVPVFNAVENSESYKSTSIFGIPLFVVLNEKDVISFGRIRKKLIEVASVLTTVDLVQEYENIKSSKPGYVDKEFYNKSDFSEVLSISDEEDSVDEYDSDVSLANPYVEGDFGFTTMYIHDYNKLASSHYFKNRLNREREINLAINVPLHKPNFHEFKPLADQLSEAKRNYYHYEKYLQQQEKGEETALSEVSSCTEEEFVMVESKSEPVVLSPSVGDEEEEETETEMVMGSLFDSSSNLPLTVSSGYSESTIPSNVNSPRSPEEPIPSSNHLVTKDTILLCDWDYTIYQKLFGEAELTTWNNIPNLSNPELERNRAHFERQRKSKISIYDCIASFSTPEILGEHDLWYCPRCEDHKRASKTIQIWSTGDILTIHLKRFHSARAFSDKIDILIDFPTVGLNISEYISDPNQVDCIYDLIAVDNHYGGLGGGHYTASVKNFRDGNWYYFNDSRVTQIESAQEVITNAAYLLFYRKRRSSSKHEFLGSDKLNELLVKGRDLYNQELINRQVSLDRLAEQIKQYAHLETQLMKELELDKEIETRKRNNKAHFNLEEEEFEEVEDDSGSVTEESEDTEDDNVRKQRLISKENNNNKLIQIKTNGRQEVTSSPINIEDENEVTTEV